MAKTYKKDIKTITKKFAVDVLKYAIYLKECKVDYPIRDQLIRSGTSIGANIVESISSSSKKEFVRYNEIALKSANETNYWIELIEEVYEQNETTKLLNDDLHEIRKILGAIIINLKKPEIVENNIVHELNTNVKTT